MTITLRPAAERGHANHGWLDTHHSFSFAHYHDPDHMGFRALRVINDDRIAPGTGFGTHGHHDMEIVTYVTEGVLEHRDSMGEHSIIRPGEVQRMSAGTGIRHSEYNGSRSETLKLLQIWLLPEKEGLPPGYEQKLFAEEEKHNRLRLIAAPDGREGALSIHQDVALYAAKLDGGSVLTHSLDIGRGAWLQMVSGQVLLNDQPMRAGDGAAVEGEDLLTVKADQTSEFLLFDLA
ncbi:pirin family protein [Telmatospirillum siberiense]|uniref:Quercetin 2,3-dioxygenase n=1 Tax=Telmatospirillum siberiense TaxID=382514 RepID=A0A2N3Q1Y6_9PROT|nr:pirin family protein [Telmatospirillum siberiense]PKU26663.1 quercetin 2,3-dioxygenase [Telmatospirillum siberiense]